MTVLRRLYIPIVSLLLLLGPGNWLAVVATADAKTVAQNPRLRFQTGGEVGTSLEPQEAALAEATLLKPGPPTSGHVQLVYLGNSQTLAIMDRRPDDKTSPQWLQVLLTRSEHSKASPVDVRVASLPNLTPTELLMILVALGEQHPSQVHILLASLVLEEFRGLGVRDEVVRSQKADTTSALAALVLQNQDLPAAAKSLSPFIQSRSSTESMSSSSKTSTLADIVEARMDLAAQRMPIFARRDQLLTWVYSTYYRGRNSLLGIDSASHRPVQDSAYFASLELIELALRYARQRSVHVILYLAPIRPVEPNPNLPRDVARFRRDVPMLCTKYETKCLDYVDAVPEELWTDYPEEDPTAKAQRDYAHFTGAAHKLLAQRLADDVATQIGQWSTPSIANGP